MRRALPVFLLLFALALPAGLGAIELSIKELAFVPARFTLGEEAEAFALVTPSGGEPVAFSEKAGAGLPAVRADDDPELRSVDLRKGRDGWELRVRFVAWSPGKGRLPAMELHGCRLPALGYEAASVLLPGDREARPPKAQLDPPGTALYLYGFLGLLIVLGLFVFGSIAWIFPAARRLLARHREGEARRALGRSLEWLRKSLSGGEGSRVDAAAFHAALARAVRLYLDERVLPGAPALTPSELSLLPEEIFPAPGLRDEAADLLGESDLVRYAGLPVDREALKAALARAARIGDRAEEALDARL